TAVSPTPFHLLDVSVCCCLYILYIFSIFCFLAVDGSWGPWEAWSKCSASCGGGDQVRTRQCSHHVHSGRVRPCPGDATQVLRCNSHACPGKNNIPYKKLWSPVIHSYTPHITVSFIAVDSVIRLYTLHITVRFIAVDSVIRSYTLHITVSCIAVDSVIRSYTLVIFSSICVTGRIHCVIFSLYVSLGASIV
uniref:Uncharacterized protein n=1 Tax=Leptobrachium leishanense TaxID=445787 RepID=A0A8C5MJV2_9ANUR